MTTESNAQSVNPHIVGNVFVQKYYNHLYESPEEVHKFYLEDSLLMRPGLDGEMVTFKSLKVSSFNGIFTYYIVCVNLNQTVSSLMHSINVSSCLLGY